MTVTPELEISSAALFVSGVALWYTARSFLLKAGTKIRGTFSIMSSASCEDRYVHEVTLYNLKDRAVAVFKIYLQLGHGIYLELDDFESDPLILKPFEAWHREYDPIEMYSVNLNRVDIEGFLVGNKIRPRLLLATADGKYVVRSWLNTWNPMILWVKNYATTIIQPRRSTFEGKAYGSNAKYVVEFTRTDGQREVVPIYPIDASTRKFKAFRLTTQSLDSASALEEFLLGKAIEGVLPVRDLKVHDLEKWRAEEYEERAKPKLTVHSMSWFHYHVLGRIVTRYQNWRQRRENSARLKKEREQRGLPRTRA